jgi:hypothetical protein
VSGKKKIRKGKGEEGEKPVLTILENSWNIEHKRNELAASTTDRLHDGHVPPKRGGG